MRRTALVLGVSALLALAGVGAATAASAQNTVAGPDAVDGPAVAHGYYLALNGTNDAGDWSPQSDTLVDPEVGRCYDLTSLATGPAAWTESVNRTDKVALLSQRSCAEKAAAPTTGVAGAEASRATRWTSPDDVSGDAEGTWAFRSVEFSSIP